MINNTGRRFWEIDFFRGLAIIIMIFFHVFYALYYFDVLTFNIFKSTWIYLAISGFSIFFILVGISLTLSYSKNIINHKSKSQIFYHNLRRGLMIFCWGLLITVITWFFIREDYVIFGVLHFIGISIIIAYPFLRLKYWNILFGIIIILIGLSLRAFSFDLPWLLWLGFRPHNFFTVDYFPLLPHFGIILIGIALGNIFYENYRRNYSIPDLSKYLGMKFFCFLGRHSLVIYLLHQPILILILISLGIINI